MFVSGSVTLDFQNTALFSQLFFEDTFNYSFFEGTERFSCYGQGHSLEAAVYPEGERVLHKHGNLAVLMKFQKTCNFI